MAQAAQQQQQGNDNSLTAFWIILLIFVTLGAIWYLAHAYIVAFVFKVKLIEADVIGLFTDKLSRLVTALKTVPVQNVTIEQLIQVSSKVGSYLSYPIAAILTGLALWLYMGNKTLRFRKTYSMTDLVNAESVNWPVVYPVLGVDLVKTDLREGPWAMAMNPLEFAKKYQLLRLEHLPSSKRVLKHQAMPTAVLNKGEAKKVFILQLGQTWQGIDALNLHTKFLFAAFAAKINRDGKAAANLLEQINRSANGKELNFSGYEALLKKYANTAPVQKIIASYGYVYTVMAAMISKAREDGVFSTAEFLWLKPRDRRLWYVLNSIGRQTPFTEIAGPFAHWLVEARLGRKIMAPMVDEAVMALDTAIKEIKYNPEKHDAI